MTKNQTAYFPVEIQDVDLKKLNKVEYFVIKDLPGNSMTKTTEYFNGNKFYSAKITHILIEKELPVMEPLPDSEANWCGWVERRLSVKLNSNDRHYINFMLSEVIANTKKLPVNEPLKTAAECLESSLSIMSCPPLSETQKHFVICAFNNFANQFKTK